MDGYSRDQLKLKYVGRSHEMSGQIGFELIVVLIICVYVYILYIHVCIHHA